MFYNKKEKWYFYIWSDNIKWKFWPFNAIFSKNRSFWIIKNIDFLEKKYPWYKYNYGLTENNSLFIINKNWIEKILKI